MKQLFGMDGYLVSIMEQVTAFRVISLWVLINLCILYFLDRYSAGMFWHTAYLVISVSVLLGFLVLRTLYVARRNVDFQVAEDRKAWTLGFRIREQSYYQNFDRDLSFEDERLLSEYWSQRLGIECSKEHIRYICNKTAQIESSCHGRLACHIQDAIIHVLLIDGLSKSNRLSYLEIGCLYGINAVVVSQFSKLYFDDIKLKLIDPLDGYYEKGVADPYTGLPISERVLVSNFQSNGIKSENYSLIKDYSSSEFAFSKASECAFNYIFIDGDHSFEGLKNDCEMYLPLLDKDGFLVIDDYQHPDWPEVTTYVDEYLMAASDLEYVGHAWKTVVFKKSPKSSSE